MSVSGMTKHVSPTEPHRLVMVQSTRHAQPSPHLLLASDDANRSVAMEFDQVAEAVGRVPHTPPEMGRRLYDFVSSVRASRILELGFAHGVSACYLAAAVASHGGSVLTIDNRSALERDPPIHELLRRTGLEHVVQPVVAARSYTWELMKLVEGQSTMGRCIPIFDFAFIDGAHSWETDGLAFFLVEKLLMPGAWLLFDDLDWTYASSPTLRATEWVRQMPEDERSTPQIGKVFDLLVRQHPGFDSHRIEGSWGWARKRPETV